MIACHGSLDACLAAHASPDHETAMPALERWALGGVLAFSSFLLVAGGLLVGLGSYRRSRAQGPPIFEEPEDVLVHRLQLEP